MREGRGGLGKLRTEKPGMYYFPTRGGWRQRRSKARWRLLTKWYLLRSRSSLVCAVKPITGAMHVASAAPKVVTGLEAALERFLTSGRCLVEFRFANVTRIDA